jgi:hypothetical protein
MKIWKMLREYGTCSVSFLFPYVVEFRLGWDMTGFENLEDVARIWGMLDFIFGSIRRGV